MVVVVVVVVNTGEVEARVPAGCDAAVACGNSGEDSAVRRATLVLLRSAPSSLLQHTRTNLSAGIGAPMCASPSSSTSSQPCPDVSEARFAAPSIGMNSGPLAELLDGASRLGVDTDGVAESLLVPMKLFMRAAW